MNTNTLRFNLLWLAVFTSIFLYSGCKEEVAIPDGAFDEHIMDLQGTWKIARVLVNNQDMTDRFDFSGFELKLNMDGNGPADFQLDNAGAPFVVVSNGNWSYDDLAFPTSINFASNSGTKSVSFAAPPISSGTEFSLTFSLGCEDNTYVYEFRKATN